MECCVRSSLHVIIWGVGQFQSPYNLNLNDYSGMPSLSPYIAQYHDIIFLWAGKIRIGIYELMIITHCNSQIYCMMLNITILFGGTILYHSESPGVSHGTYIYFALGEHFFRSHNRQHNARYWLVPSRIATKTTSINRNQSAFYACVELRLSLTIRLWCETLLCCIRCCIIVVFCSAVFSIL